MIFFRVKLSTNEKTHIITTYIYWAWASKLNLILQIPTLVFGFYLYEAILAMFSFYSILISLITGFLIQSCKNSSSESKFKVVLNEGQRAEIKDAYIQRVIDNVDDSALSPELKAKIIDDLNKIPLESDNKKQAELIEGVFLKYLGLFPKEAEVLADLVIKNSDLLSKLATTSNDPNQRPSSLVVIEEDRVAQTKFINASIQRLRDNGMADSVIVESLVATGVLGKDPESIKTGSGIADNLFDRTKQASSSLFLSTNQISEDTNLGSKIAAIYFSNVSNPQANDSLTFELSELDAFPDNSFFKIEGNFLVLNRPLDFESKNSLKINIRQVESEIESVINLNVSNVDEPASNVVLLNANLPDTLQRGGLVASLLADDPDRFSNLASTYSFSFQEGEGGRDNGYFQISGNQLLLKNNLAGIEGDEVQLRILADDSKFQVLGQVSLQITKSSSFLNVLPLSQFSSPLATNISTEVDLAKLKDQDNQFLSIEIPPEKDNKASLIARFSGDSFIKPSESFNQLNFLFDLKAGGFDKVFDKKRQGAEIAIIEPDIFGTGKDGSLIEAEGSFLTANTDEGRIKLGKSWAINRSSIIPGSTQVELDFTAYPEGYTLVEDDLVVGDEIMIYRAQLESNTTNTSLIDEVGHFIFARITEINATIVSIDKEIPTLGFSSQELKTTLFKVPNLEKMSLEGDVTVPKFTESTGEGGVLVIRVSDTLFLNGHTISAVGSGYPGNKDSNGRAAGSGVRPWLSGGEDRNFNAGGGATGYDVPGAGGGNGGTGGNTFGSNFNSPAEGGATVGDETLSRVFMGGGGGRGNPGRSCGGIGEDGGGIIIIFAKNVVGDNGKIISNGKAGFVGGGCGAGGSIWISSLQINKTTIQANGGNYTDESCDDTPTAGGAGGGGRVRLDALISNELTLEVKAGTQSVYSNNTATDGSIYKTGNEDILTKIITFASFEEKQERLTFELKTNSDSYFDSKNQFYLFIESSFPSSSQKGIESGLEIDRVQIDWQ